MPGNTSTHRIPYPLASERVADYPSTARAAAEKIDSLIPKTTPWQTLTLSRGWEATPGHTPRARWINGIVQIEGAATRRSGGAPADIARLPSDMTPTKTQFIGATTMVKSGTTTRAHAELIADQRGVLNVGDYTNIDGGVNWIIPLSAVFIPA